MPLARNRFFKAMYSPPIGIDGNNFGPEFIFNKFFKRLKKYRKKVPMSLNITILKDENFVKEKF